MYFVSIASRCILSVLSVAVFSISDRNIPTCLLCREKHIEICEKIKVERAKTSVS